MVAVGESRLSISSGVVFEEVGDELLARVPGSNRVVALSDECRDIVDRLASGESVAASDTVAQLLRVGVLTSSAPLSRRGLITAGAATAGVGIVTMVMPSVAVASSGNIPEVSLAFVDRNQTILVDGRHVVRVAVRFPVGFVAPLSDPVPISARIGTDNVASNFVTLTGNDRTEWYDTSKPVHLLFWSISTAFGGGGGWLDTDGEVAFTWGTTPYRATGDVTAVIGFDFRT